MLDGERKGSSTFCVDIPMVNAIEISSFRDQTRVRRGGGGRERADVHIMRYFDTLVYKS
jgi:hypothetical protein